MLMWRVRVFLGGSGDLGLGRFEGNGGREVGRKVRWLGSPGAASRLRNWIHIRKTVKAEVYSGSPKREYMCNCKS